MDESQDIKQDNTAFTTFRDGILFIVDATPKMFEVDPDSEHQETYFARCLKMYGSILSTKLSWNRRDWMGMILLGTNDWDKNPVETKYIKVLQEFGEITVYMLNLINDIYDKKIDKYKAVASASEYPLNDVLWQAGRTFDPIKVGMQQRQVVFLTRRDNPFENNRDEQNRIRLRAKTFSDINVSLRVIGLGENWNHELFYKDIEMLANNIASEDVKSMKLEDLELQVKLGSRVTGHLKWKIGNGLEVRTVISAFSSKMPSLKKVLLSKETNEILEKHVHWGRSYENDDSDDEFDDPESQAAVKVDAPSKIYKAIEFGDRKIVFTPEEVKKIRHTRETGIELLGFKPINHDLIYHIKPTKFISLDPTATPAETEFFAALLKKCDEKKVMATCVVAHKSGPYLANLTPYIRESGFYITRIPYAEQINFLDAYTEPYVYVGGDQGDRPLPTTVEGVALMKKILKKLRVNRDPYAFKNPKMNTQMYYIETLALDAEAQEVEDTTLPPQDIMVKQLGNLPQQFQQMFADTDCSVGERNQPTQSRSQSGPAAKRAKYDVSMIRTLYENEALESKSYADIQSIARTLRIPATGRKNEIFERVLKYCQSKF